MVARKFNVNSRTVATPLAAFCMACILFVYARTSIQAAKRNAQKHRDADGGQISWRNETLRRHGVLEPPEEQGVKQLFLGSAGPGSDAAVKSQGGSGKTLQDEIVKSHSTKGKGL